MSPRSGSLKLSLFRSIRRSRRSYGDEKEGMQVVGHCGSLDSSLPLACNQHRPI
jgi:hypothetical protein